MHASQVGGTVDGTLDHHHGQQHEDVAVDDSHLLYTVAAEEVEPNTHAVAAAAEDTIPCSIQEEGLEEGQVHNAVLAASQVLAAIDPHSCYTLVDSFSTRSNTTETSSSSTCSKDVSHALPPPKHPVTDIVSGLIYTVYIIP